jgi:hypothetical protein
VLEKIGIKEIQITPEDLQKNKNKVQNCLLKLYEKVKDFKEHKRLLKEEEEEEIASNFKMQELMNKKMLDHQTKNKESEMESGGFSLFKVLEILFLPYIIFYLHYVSFKSQDSVKSPNSSFKNIKVKKFNE